MSPQGTSVALQTFFKTLAQTAPVLGCQTARSTALPTAISVGEQQLCNKGSPGAAQGTAKCRGRGGMEESYETFEEEFGSPRADPPPQKPVRQIRRPEMYTTRKMREEIAPVQPRTEPKTLPREPSSSRTTTIHKTLTVQSVTQTETPWENVTLNRCLFVAITILVLTSGFQRLHETLRGQEAVEEQEEEVGLRTRRLGTLRQRGHRTEPETSLWEVMFWWLPDLDDEDDEEEDEEEDGMVKKGKSKKGAATRAPRGLRNKPLPHKKLMKQSDRRLKDRRAKRAQDEEIKEKSERAQNEDTEEATEHGDEGDEDTVSKKTKKSVEKKEKKKTRKG